MTKQFVVTCLAVSPVWNILRKRALRERPLTLLCYHTLGPNTGGVDSWTVLRDGDFRVQLDDLEKHYEIVCIDEGLKPDPGTGKPRAVITFDDGDRGLYKHLLPILKKRPIPVTVYVATSQIETGRPYWFDRVVNSLQVAGRIQIDGLGQWKLPKSKGKAYWSVLSSILEALKRVDPAEREAFTDQLEEMGAPHSDLNLQPMRLGELKELAATPGVTIGAHSHGHELLDQIPMQEARKSVARSRELLREWTGQEVNHFSYPNGNHTPALIKMLRELGFASATILGNKVASSNVDPFALPRIAIGRYDAKSRFRLRLIGM